MVYGAAQRHKAALDIRQRAGKRHLHDPGLCRDGRQQEEQSGQSADGSRLAHLAGLMTIRRF